MVFHTHGQEICNPHNVLLVVFPMVFPWMWMACFTKNPKVFLRDLSYEEKSMVETLGPSWDIQLQNTGTTSRLKKPIMVEKQHNVIYSAICYGSMLGKSRTCFLTNPSISGWSTICTQNSRFCGWPTIFCYQQQRIGAQVTLEWLVPWPAAQQKPTNSKRKENPIS